MFSCFYHPVLCSLPLLLAESYSVLTWKPKNTCPGTLLLTSLPHTSCLCLFSFYSHCTLNSVVFKFSYLSEKYFSFLLIADTKYKKDLIQGRERIIVKWKDKG
jgi:hypothetical protein